MVTKKKAKKHPRSIPLKKNKFAKMMAVRAPQHVRERQYGRCIILITRKKKNARNAYVRISVGVAGTCAEHFSRQR